MTKRTLITLSAALLILVIAAGTVSAEDWVMTGVDHFSLTQALQRSQGVAFDSDTNTLLFSWQYGLQRTTLDYTILANDPRAIPRPLRLRGSDHIGCLDYYAGRLYAPIEDGDDRNGPVIALYDAQTLAFTGDYFPLPTDIQNDGVPWVAVDAARGLAYSAKWNPIDRINAYDLSNFTFVKAIPLDVTLGRIQGAKVYDGALYAAADDDNHTVYRIELDTGQVTELFRLIDLPGVYPDDPWLETEGLAFYPANDGSSLHITLIQGVYDSRNPTGLLPVSSLFHFRLAE